MIIRHVLFDKIVLTLLSSNAMNHNTYLHIEKFSDDRIVYLCECTHTPPRFQRMHENTIVNDRKTTLLLAPRSLHVHVHDDIALGDLLRDDEFRDEDGAGRPEDPHGQ